MVSLLASQLHGVMSHGYIDEPTSRNQLVCRKAYPDMDWYSPPLFDCLTDRETPAQSPLFSGLPAGMMAGDMPGVAKVYTPVCSAGHDSRISDAAIAGLNERGPSMATWLAGSTQEVSWNVQASHGGVYSYRLCCDGSDTEECFQQNVLEGEDGNKWFPIPNHTAVPPTTSDKRKVKIPQHLSGLCTLSWRWDGGCKVCDPDQTSESSVFVSCADVTITSGPTPPAPSPPPSPAPPPPSPAPTPPSPAPAALCGYATCAEGTVCCCSADKNIGYCVDEGSDPSGSCAGHTMCPSKEGCCGDSRLGFLAAVV